MKRFVVYCLILSAALLLITGCKKKEEPAVVGEVHEKKPAPEITVNSLTNVPLKLSSLKGKVVLLNFWATWCPPCRDEMPSMMKLNSAMAGKPYQMVSVSIDEGGVPESFLIDKNGILVKKVIGPLAWDSPETIAFIEGLMK